MLERLVFFIRHSLNDMRVNKQRTLFALLCIAAGVAAIVSLQTLAVMINNSLTGSLQESNRGDLRLTPNNRWQPYVIEPEEDSLSGGYVVTQEGMDYVQEWLDDRYPGSTMTYRQPLTGFVTGLTASIPARDTDKYFIFNFIIEADKYPLYGSVKTDDGETLADLLQEPTDIVLSQNLADDLEAQVGDSLRLYGAKADFTVRGIVPTDSEAGFQNFGAGLLGYYYLDVSAVSLFDDVEPGQASELYIRLADPSKVDVAAGQIDRAFRGFNVTSTSDLEEMNSSVSDTVDDMVVVMGLVSLLIGGIGIVNTMLVIVSRRTAEVAVLKTLGLTPREVTVLFLVEAILMGIVGSALGVVGGWVLAYGTKGIAENFLGQSLDFVIASRPALNGLVVGVIITAIFGFLPTLAAGQVRPANVLRPSDTVIPRAGRLASMVAVFGLVLALSAVAQGLLGDLLADVPSLDVITPTIGAVYGLAMALPLVLNDYLSMRERRRGRRWLLRPLLWLVLLAALPAAGAAFGSAVPAILILTVTAVIVGYLYILFWFIIWAVGGGRFGEIWPGALSLLFPLFWPLIPVLIILLIPLWLLGRLIQRLSFVDLKIAMRGMLSTKGRGASTLLALVIGIFTLSVITMLVDSITKAFENLLEQASGGNVLVVTFSASNEMIDNIRGKMEEQTDNLNSFAIVAGYNTRLTDYWDASSDSLLDSRQRGRVSGWFFDAEGREISSNLPDLEFAAGRNLDPNLDSQPDADGVWSAVVTEPITTTPDGFTVDVGDILTLIVNNRHASQAVQLRVVGVAKESGVVIGTDSSVYAPLGAFEGYEPTNVLAVADAKEAHIRDVRRSLSELPGVFVIETRFINDLINRLVNQFTSFPLLVATLALFTGGVVIANSVALSTMERRREIGVMKAVGLQRERVLGMLLLENGLMGLIGGLIGVGVSFVILVVILTQTFEGELGDAIPYGIAFALMGLCILISLVAAIVSVWTASGEKPLNVLRYE
jgi:putative ABC transport system permease protein